MKAILPKVPLLKRFIVLGVYFQCLLVGATFASAANEPAKSIENIYLSLMATDSELEEVFTVVSEKTGFNFQYKQDMVNSHSLSLTMKEVSLGACLRQIAKETGLSFRRINETIHVDRSGNSEASVTEIMDDQQGIRVTGKVTSANGDGEGLPGVTVLIKGTQQGTVTDVDGNYTITVPSPSTVLVFSFVGFAPQEVTVGNQTTVDVSLEDDVRALDEVVVIGYGEQKKETVVGAVTQTNTEVLERTAGIPNVATALTGNLPGLITTASSGMPGQENPRIVIRGNNTWNGDNGPLILVDGVERPDFFNNMDVNSVESISVLKDATATAVFGSRGGNGVVIVTTKRGRVGKAEITANVNSTVKLVSKLPGTKPAYEAIGLRNRAIEYELGISPESWDAIIPEDIRYKYLHPANATEAERYPNVDWQDEMFGNYAMAYNANVGVRGGTEFVKYFANVDFQSENDLFRDIQNGRGYDPGYAFNRLNFRTNLDFQLTPTTQFKANLGGSYAVRKSPWGGGNSYPFWIAAYGNSPTAYIPQYDDGAWGYYQPNENAAVNSVRNLAISGLEYQTTNTILTNFVLNQDLSMLLKGLSIKGSVALDNRFMEIERGVNDQYNALREKWIDPETGQIYYKTPFEANTRFDNYTAGASWTPSAGAIDSVDNGGYRQIFYQGQVNYNTTIAQRHNVNLMALMNRLERAAGDEIPNYREDWVFRATYNFDGKYLVEYNGAYNGSEKFGPGYRFKFFSSGGIGWVISEENFMNSLPFVNYLKIRASYGEVGDDGGSSRFAYTDNWSYGGNAKLGVVGWESEESPYTWYQQSGIGNPAVRWETVYKYNFATEFELFDGFINGSLDLFRDRRVDVFMTADDRNVPSYFGADAPSANLGKVTTEGFEVTLGVNHTLGSGVRLWADFAVTHAKDEVIFRDDPELLEDYQKNAGYQLGQARTHVSSGFYNNWDQLYASTTHNTNNDTKLPGNYHILDYNGDGIIDNLDVIPYGFSGTPQNTYNANVGFEWRGLSAFVQFYGVNNVTRWVEFSSLGGQTNRAYEEGSYWSQDNTDADTPMPRWLSLVNGANNGSRYYYDGSYLRLKNAEIAYRFTSGWVNKVGLSSLRVYLNGNNLLLWTDMPDDRESNFATNLASQGAYPTVKRINLGLNLVF